MIGYMCGPRVYEFEGVVFETSYIIGPWPLKKNGDPKARCGKKFYDWYKKFDNLPPEEQEKYRLGGGCTRIEKE